MQDLASAFTTKELLCRCFAKRKVISYTAFFESAEQLLFGTSSHGCLSMYLSQIFTKVRQLPSKQLHVQGQQIQKLDNLSNLYKVYNKDNLARLIDLVLVSLLLTYFRPCSSVSIVDFEQVNAPWLENSIIHFGNDVILP